MPVSDEGREQSFVELYERHYGSVLGYLRRRASEAAARDVAADTFLTAWRRLDVAADGGLPWLYRTAALTLRNVDRTERRQQRTCERLASLPASGLEGDLAIAQATRSEVFAAIRQLPEVDRELLLLVAWEELDLRSAAAVIGRSPGAAAVRLHRARRKLRRLLADQPVTRHLAQETSLSEVTP